ncbi:hypothetical protein MRX96_024790 [Rhipicephalus microplus]
MVIYFKSTVVSPPAVIFMGVDKFENEDLIKWGWPEDVWFHVDKVSSAHVYLRLQPNQTLDDVPSSVLEDCAQLVKANSIQGNKMNSIDVVYTMWGNLKKTQGMEVGQVGFHKQKEDLFKNRKQQGEYQKYTTQVLVLCPSSGPLFSSSYVTFCQQCGTIRVEKRINEIVNRLMKTKEERQPDLRAEREERDHKEREDKKQILREQKEREKQEQKEKEEQAKLRSYDTLMKGENMKSNKEDGYDSDDFM